MTKIMIYLFVVLNTIIFGKMVSHPNFTTIQEEIILDRARVFNLESEVFKITGLGNMSRLYYFIGNYDERFQNKNGSTDSIILENVRLVKTSDIHNETGNYIEGVNGKTSFRILGKIRIKPDPRISGEYTSRVTVRFSENNSSVSSEELVEVQFKVKVLKSLQLETTTMDLGGAVRGMRLSTKSGGNPGYLRISGAPRAEVEIEFPERVLIQNINDSKILTVDILTTPSSDGGELEVYLSDTGSYTVRFDGEVKDTSKASSGMYRGNFKIQVRYD